MSYREAKAQIVSMLEACSTMDAVNGVSETRRAASTFKYFPDASDDKLPKPRGFWLRATQHAMRGPVTPGLPTRLFAAMVLSVAYRFSADPSVDDDNMAFDHRVLSTSLLDGAQWGRPSSSIISIHAEGDLLCPSQIDLVGPAPVLRISFALEYLA